MSEWVTCDECQANGRVHASQAELEADPIGTWRREWRGGCLAVRWLDHPCDDPPKAWAVFTQWGVDEVPHVSMQESHRISAEEASAELSRLAGGAAQSASAGPVSGAVPDVRLIPAGSVGGWPRDVVAIRRDRGLWRCTNSAWLSDAEVEQHGQLIIPAYPLLTLADHWELHARFFREEAGRSDLNPNTAGWCRGRAQSFKAAATDLREQLAYLFDKFPDSHTRQDDQ